MINKENLQQSLICFTLAVLIITIINEPVHEISNNVVCATSKRAVWSEPLLVAWEFYDC